VGKAAQSFNIPEIPGVMSGWISGYVARPALFLVFPTFYGAVASLLLIQ
jgi:hypothetical protein